MEKKIEDYLHLYLGCDLHCGGELTPKKIQEFIDGERDNQLLLRPLSDMTEEEAMKLNCYFKWIDNISTEKKSWSDFEYSPESFMLLLKEGFDLFNLIPDGLAIDKTKLPTLNTP